jgi:hypothetical protein
MKKSILILLSLFIAIFLGTNTYAMSSTNYKIDWFVLLNSSGGGEASSATYKVNYTIGQTAIGASAGSSYRVGLGYWTGLANPSIHLPLILKN